MSDQGGMQLQSDAHTDFLTEYTRDKVILGEVKLLFLTTSYRVVSVALNSVYTRPRVRCGP